MPGPGRPSRKHRSTSQATSEPTQGEINNSDSSNLDDSSNSMGDKGRTLDDIFELLQKQDKKLNSKLDGLTAKFSDLEKAVTYTQHLAEETSVADLRKDYSTIEAPICVLEAELQRHRSKAVADERRSREWGIRIFGVPIQEKEDTPKIVSEIIVKYQLNGVTDLTTADQLIEHCHRLTRPSPQAKDNRPPGIIVNFFSRPVRHKILRHAKATVNKSKTGIFVLEDLTKQDRALKKAAKPQMMEAHAQGHSVWFSRGKLYINSQVVQIKQ